MPDRPGADGGWHSFTDWNLPSLVRYYQDVGLDPIISRICDQADDFLAGVTKREEAKAGIAEFLTMYHAGLTAADRQAVTDQVIVILDREGFFERDAGGEG